MFDPKIFDDLAKKLSQLVPEGVKHIQSDIEKQFRELLQQTFSKCDLVTREEFDVQVKVLARTREKVDALERQLAELQKTDE